MEIKLTKHTKEFYDEALYIEVFYKKKLLKKPKQKVKELTKSIKSSIVLVAVAILSSIGFLTSSILNKNYINAGAEGTILLVFIAIEVILNINLFVSKKTLNDAKLGKENNLKKELWLDDKRITQVVYTDDGIKGYELAWKEIKLILINKHSIAIFPTDIEKPKIFISSEYKDKILSEANRYKHNDLVVDNTLLYKKDK